MFVRRLLSLFALAAVAGCGSTDPPSITEQCLNPSTYVTGSCVVGDGRCFDYGPSNVTAAAQANCAQVYRGMYRAATCASMGYIVDSGTIVAILGDQLCVRLAAGRATDGGAPRD